MQRTRLARALRTGLVCGSSAPHPMHQMFPTSFALLERTALAGRSLARGAETVTTGGPDLTWLMGVVAMLLAAIAAMAFGFRKVVMGSMNNRAAKRDMRILDVLPLGGKRQLAVVRCYDRTFALGLGEKSVELVAELDDAAVEADRAKRTATQKTVASVPERAQAFQERLVAAKARLLGAHAMGAGPEGAPSAPRAAEPAPVVSIQDKDIPSPSVQPFVPAPVAAPTVAPAPAQPLGEVSARSGSNREFIA